MSANISEGPKEKGVSWQEEGSSAKLQRGTSKSDLRKSKSGVSRTTSKSALKLIRKDSRILEDKDINTELKEIPVSSAPLKEATVAKEKSVETAEKSADTITTAARKTKSKGLMRSVTSFFSKKETPKADKAGTPDKAHHKEKKHKADKSEKSSQTEETEKTSSAEEVTLSPEQKATLVKGAERLIQEISERNLDEKGIFRISGNESETAELVAKLKANPEAPLDVITDIHVLTNALKKLIDDLEIIKGDLKATYLISGSPEASDNDIAKILTLEILTKRFAENLNSETKVLLNNFLDLCSEIAKPEHSDKNLMPANNLAIVPGGKIMKSADNPFEVMSETSKSAAAFLFLLANYKEILR